MKALKVLVVALVLSLPNVSSAVEMTLAFGAPPPVFLLVQPPPIQLVPILSGLSRPTFVTHASDGSNRVFIVEQAGVVKVLQPGSSTPTVFLDIHTKVVSGGERGHLYIGVGDGGSANDPPNNAQNVNALLGKILRIDIDHRDVANFKMYASPADNPNVGKSECLGICTRGDGDDRRQDLFGQSAGECPVLVFGFALECVSLAVRAKRDSDGRDRHRMRLVRCQQLRMDHDRQRYDGDQQRRGWLFRIGASGAYDAAHRDDEGRRTEGDSRPIEIGRRDLRADRIGGVRSRRSFVSCTSELCRAEGNKQRMHPNNRIDHDREL